MKQIVFVVLAQFIGFQTAFGDASFGIKATAHANAALMASPTLPRLFTKIGASEIYLRPAMISASNEESRGQDPKIIDYEGYGLAVMYHRRLSRRFGYFVQLMGNTITGDFTSPGGNPGDPDQTIFANGIKSSLFVSSSGISFSLYRSGNIELQLLVAPAFSSISMSQTIVQNDPADPDDFDMTMDFGVLSYYAGLQLGLRIWGIILNPYIIISDLINSADQCQSYAVTVRTSGNLFDLGSESCFDKQGNSQGKVEYNTALMAYGLNLVLADFGVGVTAYSDTGEIPFFEGVEVEALYLTLSYSF